MIIIDNIADMLNLELGSNIGFVPTMGNLHIGHTSLISRSKNENAKTVVSIFINPTQFNNDDDFSKYPRTLNEDVALLKELGVDVLFLPNFLEIYPDDFTIKINEVSQLSEIMEGKFRPGHFTGMLTIVCKLLNIVSPNKAYFGKKDYQQWRLVENMAKALFLSTEIIGCDIIRNENGLPLSSRNNRLSKDELKMAANFSKLLSSDLKCSDIKIELEKIGFTVDYIEEYEGRRLGAVYINNVRLIDNCEL